MRFKNFIEPTALQAKYLEINSLLNKSNKMDGLSVINTLPTNSVFCCFFDPEHSGVLDEVLQKKTI